MTCEVERCMALVREGLDKHHLLADDLPELMEHVRRNQDFTSGELMFEFVADRLRVSLHDRDDYYDPAQFIEALDKFLRGIS